mgnify:CR=1 FL=1
MTELNSNDYLELCNQLKEINEKRESEELKMKDKISQYHKSFITIYGFIRQISNLIEPTELDAEVYMIIEVLRGMVSEIVEEEILKFNPFYIE